LKINSCGHAIGMGIGVSIFMMAFGAILTFALHWTVAGLDLKVVGWVFMLAGAGGLVLFFYFFWGRRRATRPVAIPQRVYDDTRPPPA
jgi:uncharacterized iron-regulated membrane protein